MLQDIEIAQKTTPRPIDKVAEEAGIPQEHLYPYGRYKAKLSLEFCKRAMGRNGSRLVLVTGINPTPAGEGKSTVTVGLGDGLRRIGKKSVICLREPSLGPCFGIKGGAAGGGYSQVIPMEDINLHFTGDFHAITSAHNLLAAMIDNHIHQGNELGLDVRRLLWDRVMDMNDRALRNIIVGTGGPRDGIPRQSKFDITVASEVMAVLCLAEGLGDLKRRIGEMVIAETKEGEYFRVRDIKAQGAMTALLKEALSPNLVQTLEGTPALVHGGPFANIAHGCNSVMATKVAMSLGDYTITEAGFGADLGAEKFFNIKCRIAGLIPDAVVLVATVRAMKMHGGVPRKDLKQENLEALEKGSVNLRQHLENLRKFGLPVVVALNHFSHDTGAEVELVAAKCAEWEVPMVVSRGWELGGEGTTDLARAVDETISSNPGSFRL
ncbi:MAG: formate--tetrahydrofolate ligase, partial [Deltaproteobacteria bacterium]|nr:formate--tetrahydrofolate ligase [Deltaproteobacteria bacterium]